MQSNCEVLVYIDLKRAVKEGIKFYRGSDGVLWTDGNSQGTFRVNFLENLIFQICFFNNFKGFLPPKYFNCAVHVSPVTGQQIYYEDLTGKLEINGIRF